MIEVVGIGVRGTDELPAAQRELVTGAKVLLGGHRHFAVVPENFSQRRIGWPSPLRAGLPALLAYLDAENAADGSIVALASGDPLRSGIATMLVDLLGAEKVRIHPSVSSDTLARARMGWSAESVDVVTLVGRSIERLARFLDPGARLVVLCSDGQTPARVARLLVDEGLGSSTVTALWQLGGPREGRRSASARDFGSEATDPLVVVCVEVDREHALRRPALGPTPGLPESAYDTDGQLTKRDVRASALAHLRPTRGAVLWDLGAGTGSVGIEWARALSDTRSIAVERNADRAERVRRNAARLGVPDRVEVLETDVLSAVQDAELPTPDAVFIGGGLSAEVLSLAWQRIAPGGRLVAHAVTLGSEAVLVEAQARHGGLLTRLAIEHAEPLGRHLSWTPARPIVQYSVTRPNLPGAAPGEQPASTTTTRGDQR